MNLRTVLTGFFTVLWLCGCNEITTYTPMDPSGLDANAAYIRVESFTNLGPKPATTPAGKAAAEWIRQELTADGVTAEIDSFEQPTPKGTGNFHNVIATLPGSTEDIIILGSHFDTKLGIEGFVGANDSASSTGLLLELARYLKAHYKQGPEIRCLFFDGEECMVNYGPEDGLHGSRYYAQKVVDQGERKRIKAVIILDMIGDKDLTVTIPRNSHADLVSLAFKSAAKQGVREKFSLYAFNIGDDHVPFVQRGIPAIDLIDFQYGTAPGRHDIWHTPNDTMEHISADSLDAVGRTTLEMINELARRSVEGE